MMRIKFAGMALAISMLGILAGCGGGSSTPAASNPSLSGVAAVGSPIVGGAISVRCAAGSALAPVTTGSTGAWQIGITGQTLPCAVQVSGGTVNGATNATPYHSIATAAGTVNVTPLTDLMVANLAGTASPDTWFTGLGTTPTPLTAISQTSVDTALTNLRSALPELTPLATLNPITTAFTPVPGNQADDMLAALATAMSNSGSVTHASLLTSASAPTITPPAGFGTALTSAYAGTSSGGASAIPAIPTGVSATASGSTLIDLNWVSVSGATGYNIYRSTSTSVQIVAGNKINAAPVQAGPFQNTGLTASTAYYYKITAVNTAGESVGSVEVSATTSAVAVTPPAGIVASATTTAQNLTVGMAMNSFSPLTAIGGTAPYTYSYTGTLPAGLSFNTNTGAVTGTPTAAYTTANLVFSVKDANNVVASTTSTVSFSVAAAAALPAGYVSQGGLTWMPVTFTDTWTNADTYCTATTINGVTGWRMPTKTELGALYTSGTMNGQGWTLGSTWSSTEYSAGYYYNIDLGFGYVRWDYTTWKDYVSCVRENDIAATATATAQNLTVGAAMTGFSPLAARGGATPYTYSYTGTLPAGLSINTSTGVVTGTPTAVYSTANVVFSVKDANNVVASMTSTVSFSVTAAGGGAASALVGGAIQGVPLALTQAVTTLAGGLYNIGSLDGTGLASSFNYPYDVTTDGSNLYVADTSSYKIRKIEISTGVVTTLAGSGTQGSVDGTGLAASFSYPLGITCDGSNLYVSDASKIRKVVIATGVVTTLAGGGALVGGASVDGTGPAASFKQPTGITTDGNNLYVSDYLNNTIRKIDLATNVVTTLAGTPTSGSADGIGAAASFYWPRGITTDGTNLYVADAMNNKIRKIEIATGVVSTLAGGYGSADGTGLAASFFNPFGVTTDGSNLYVADSGNYNIRKIVIATGVVTTLAGKGLSTFSDGTGAAAAFKYPVGITTDGSSLFVADTNSHRIRKIQ